MWSRAVLLVAAALPWLSQSAPTATSASTAVSTPTAMSNSSCDAATGCPPLHFSYDVIVIGGGPSGLAGTSGLARVRRKVLMVDSGDYRNGATRHLHDLPGNDGQTPAYYRFVARKQIAMYGTVTMINGTVTRVQPQQNNTFFTVDISLPGDQNITYTARKVVFATGLKDQIPPTPGLRENFGKGIYWCPWCDGHEHADQQLGILGPVTSAPGSVREVSTLNEDIIAFTNGTAANQTAVEATEARFAHWEEYMRIKKVTVDDRVLTSIERLRDGYDPSADPSLPTHPEHDLFRIHFETGDPVLRNAIMINVPTDQSSTLAADTGVRMVNGRAETDSSKGLLSSVPGIYVVGDAGNGATNIPSALFTGKRMAVYAHVQIAREETDKLLQEAGVKDDGNDGTNNLARRSVHDQARDLWDEVNGPRGDPLYAGDFDQL